MASNNSTKNTDFEGKKSAAILGNDQMDEVRVKLDNVHKLLRKQACLVEDADVVDTEDRVEEDVNFIGGTGIQRSGNQNGNFYGNGQKSNFNQSSQYQKPYSHNYSNNNRIYGNSSYQTPPPPTQEGKFEGMLDRVLKGQQSMTVDFNGKIDSVYNNLNTKFATLSTHVKKLEMQVVET